MQSHILHVREVTLEEAFVVHQAIPEFQDHLPYQIETFVERTRGKDTLCIIVVIDEEAVGYIVAYDRDADGSFYCWMAGVRPEFRKLGALTALMGYLEQWSRSHGYGVLTIKTRNQRREMLLYLLKNGFNVIEVEMMQNVGDNRILFQKSLT